MSWTPTFWIKRSDYDKIRLELPDHDAWPLRLHNKGVVLPSELSSTARDIHDILEHHAIPHWILNGESDGCAYSTEWGERLEPVTEFERQGL